MSFIPTIGLEIHCQIKTKTKMFCACLNNPDEKKPNTNICPICLGHPGALPVANIEAIKKTIKLGLALGCEIAHIAKFDRKNYFYPDLPKGYQISQLYFPFCQKGFLEIEQNLTSNNIAVDLAHTKKIRIRKVHLEEDTAKLVHDKEGSLIDFNRAGMPLLELVTEPDISSEKEARKFAEELQLIFRYLDISEANMEKGEMRIEANISLMPASKKNNKLGTKVEIKNLNSFKAVEEAILYEINRQTDILKKWQEVIQETRGWNEKQKKTICQRIKETVKDYRYFPEPNLPIFLITTTKKKTPFFIANNIKTINAAEIKKTIPLLPQLKRKIFISKHCLSKENAQILIEKQKLGLLFEKVLQELQGEFTIIPPQLKQIVANYLINDLQDLQKKFNRDSLISHKNLAEFSLLIYKNNLSSKSAKIVLQELFTTNKNPTIIIKDKGLILITDKGELDLIAKKIIQNNPQVVKKYQQGKKETIQFLIGQGMKESNNKISPVLIKQSLERLLNN